MSRPYVYQPGDRVSTPGGQGTVAYVRMAPYYTQPEAVSVVLDARRTAATYAGTIYRAEQVALVAQAPLARLLDATYLAVAPACPDCGAGLGEATRPQLAAHLLTCPGRPTLPDTTTTTTMEPR